MHDFVSVFLDILFLALQGAPSTLSQMEFQFGFNLVSVDERKSSDHVVKSIESGLDEVLGVVTQQLKEGKHGKTSMLKFLELALVLLITEVGLSEAEVSEDTPVINGSNEEDDLGPSEGGDEIDGGDTVWDVVGGDTGCDVVSEAVGLGGNVSEDGEHADTSVLELGSAVFGELLLRDVLLVQVDEEETEELR